MEPRGEAAGSAATTGARHFSRMGRIGVAPPSWLPEYLAALLASAIAVGLLVLRTDLKTMGTIAFADPGWDRHLYVEMARRGLFDFQLAPYCWRILQPALAAALPLPLQASFMTVTFTALVTLGVAVYALARAAGFSRWHAATSLLLLFSLGWGPKFVVSDFWVPDALATVITVLAFIFARRNQPKAMAATLAVGVLAKESVLFVAPLLYTLNARTLLDWRQMRTTLLVAAPALFVFAALRVLIPAANGDATYLAGMPPVISRFPGLFPPYNYLDRFNEIARDSRWAHLSWSDVDPYLADPFGVALLALALIGGFRVPRLALRLAPFLLLVYSQLLFATDTQRLLVLAFPALVLLAMPGLDAVTMRLRVPIASVLPAAVALFALTLLGRDDFGSPLLLQSGVIAVWLAAATGARFWRGQHREEKPPRAGPPAPASSQGAGSGVRNASTYLAPPSPAEVPPEAEAQQRVEDERHEDGNR